MINVKQFFAKLSDLPVTMVNFLATVQKRLLTPLSALFLQITGYTIFNLFDAFSVASLILIVFKLLLRLLGADPSYALNLSILLLGIIFSLKVNLIEFVREGLIKFWKKVLGERFYYYPNTFELAQLINNYSNLKEITIINKIFLELFYLFILIRLVILSEPYLFIFINIILNYFLIVNKYLLISSFLSIIIVFSRFTFYLTNYTNKTFFQMINRIENLKENETLKPSRENAILVGILITRYFHLPGEERRGFNDFHDFSSYYVIDKIKAYNKDLLEKLKKDLYDENCEISLARRLLQRKRDDKNEIILKKSKINNYFLFTFSLIGIILILYFLTIPQVSTFDSAFGKFIRIPTKSMKEAKGFWKNPDFWFDFTKGPHPGYLKINKDKNLVFAHNESTLNKQRVFPNLRKHGIPDITNKNTFKPIKPFQTKEFSIVQSGYSFTGKENIEDVFLEYEFVAQEIQEILEKNPCYINANLLGKLKELAKTNEEKQVIDDYLDFRGKSFGLIQHDSIGFFNYALLDSRFSHKDIEEIMTAGKRYYTLAIKNDQGNCNSLFLKQQLNLRKEQAEIFQDFCKVLERYYLDLDYSSIEHPQVGSNMLLLRAINEAANENTPVLHVKKEMSAISSITKQNLEELSGDYSNGELIKSSVFT